MSKLEKKFFFNFTPIYVIFDPGEYIIAMVGVSPPQLSLKFNCHCNSIKRWQL